MAITGQHLPASRHKAGPDILRNGQADRPINRDAIIIKQHNQPAKPQMASQTCCLMADPFHQTAIPGDCIGEMIHQIIAILGVQMPLSHRHADRIGNALSQRASGCFNPARMAKLRMPGGACAQLAELAQLIQSHIGIAGQIKQRINQHGAMPG